MPGIDVTERDRRKGWAKWNDGEVRGRQTRTEHEPARTNPMTKLSEIFPSPYLKACDIPDPGLRVVIAHVSMEELGIDRDVRPVAYFDGIKRGLVMNKTNANLIAAICRSDDTDQWVGKEVLLVTEPVAFQGRVAPAIRVRPPEAPAKRPSRAPASVRDASDDLNDVVPF